MIRISRIQETDNIQFQTVVPKVSSFVDNPVQFNNVMLIQLPKVFRYSKRNVRYSKRNVRYYEHNVRYYEHNVRYYEHNFV